MRGGLGSARDPTAMLLGRSETRARLPRQKKLQWICFSMCVILFPCFSMFFIVFLYFSESWGLRRIARADEAWTFWRKSHKVSTFLQRLAISTREPQSCASFFRNCVCNVPLLWVVAPGYVKWTLSIPLGCLTLRGCSHSLRNLRNWTCNFFGCPSWSSDDGSLECHVVPLKCAAMFDDLRIAIQQALVSGNYLCSV